MRVRDGPGERACAAACACESAEAEAPAHRRRQLARGWRVSQFRKHVFPMLSSPTHGMAAPSAAAASMAALGTKGAHADGGLDGAFGASAIARGVGATRWLAAAVETTAEVAQGRDGERAAGGGRGTAAKGKREGREGNRKGMERGMKAWVGRKEGCVVKRAWLLSEAGERSGGL
eukprot:1592700-Pleurochrysis_carterae.AAC.1